MTQTQDPTTSYQAAKELLNDRRYRSACAAFEKLAYTDTDARTEIERLWGRALVGLGNYEEAEPHFERAVEADPANSDAYEGLRSNLNLIMDPEAAIARVQQTVNRANSEAAHANWGGTLALLKRYPAAITEYEGAARCGGEDAEIHARWSRSLANLGRHEEAIDRYRTYLEKAFNDRIAHISLHFLTPWFSTLHSPEPLISQLQKVVDDRDSPELRITWGGTLHMLGRREAAAAEYQKALAKKPGDIAIHVELALELEAIGLHEEAELQYESALEAEALSAVDYGIYDEISIALASLKSPDAAIARIQKLVDRVDTGPARAWWATVLAQLGRHDDAIAEFEKGGPRALDNTPDFYASWGNELATVGQDAEAVSQYVTALARDPTEEAHQRAVEESLRKLPNLEKALSDVQRRIDQLNTPATYAAWGRVLLSLGKPRAATSQYAKAAATTPPNTSTSVDWAQALVADAQHDEGIARFGMAIDQEPARHETYETIRSSLAHMKPEMQSAAIERLQPGLDRADDAKAFLEWGRVLHQVGKYSAAATQFERAASKTPGDPDPQLDWARALGGSGRHSEAAQRCARSIDLSGGDIVVIQSACDELAKQCDHLDNDDDVVAAVQRSIDVIAGAHAYLQWGYTLTRVRRLAVALTQYEKAKDKNPADANVSSQYAEVLVLANQSAKGLDHHRYAAERQPNDRLVQYRWGMSLLRLQRYEEAKEKFEKATDLGAQFALFDWALALEGLDSYEAAIAKYEECIEKTREDIDKFHHSTYSYLLPYALHNIAAVRERQGDYLASCKAWEVARSAYQDAAGDARENNNAPFFLYCGYLHHDARKDLKSAEEQYRFALGLSPQDTDILAALVRLHLERKQNALFDDQTRERATDDHWKAWEAFRKAKRIFSRQIGDIATTSRLLELGKLHLTMSEHKEAKELLVKALAAGGDSLAVNEWLGRTCLAAEEFKEAVKYCTAAMERDPTSLDLRNCLADAYLKDNALTKAEHEYQNVLAVAPGSVDALIGSGNVYVSMAEDLQKNGKSSDAENMFSQAIDQYSQAASVAGMDKGSRKLSPSERAAISYSRGYASAMRYDTQTLATRDPKLLDDALRDFGDIPSRDPNYHKAERAKLKIRERRQSSGLSSARLTTLFIGLGAFITFVTANVAFWGGKPGLSTAFHITEQSLRALQAEKLPEAVLAKLLPLTKLEAVPKDTFDAQVKAAVGEESAGKFGDAVRRQASISRMTVWQEPIETGYFALLVFGSLMFMTAGLYLDQLSKLKFGVFELEKTTETGNKTHVSLGITR